MNLEEKKEQIKILIKDLFYLSESDYPWQITSITPSEHVITEQEVDVDLFFNNLSHPSDMVDEFMRIQAKKYDLLFQFIKSNFNEIKIVKHGRIKRPVIVELTDENSKSIFLTTHSLET
jgi:hypothetical protein